MYVLGSSLFEHPPSMWSHGQTLTIWMSSRKTLETLRQYCLPSNIKCASVHIDIRIYVCNAMITIEIIKYKILYRIIYCSFLWRINWVCILLQFKRKQIESLRKVTFLWRQSSSQVTWAAGASHCLPHENIQDAPWQWSDGLSCNIQQLLLHYRAPLHQPSPNK